METLIECPHCKLALSSHLLRCIHCHKFVPISVTCIICLNEAKSADSIFHQDRRKYTFFHKQCYKKILNEVVCYLCMTDFSQEELRVAAKSLRVACVACANCGAENKISQCMCCKNYVIVQNAVRRGRDCSDYPSEFDYYHQLCKRASDIIPVRTRWDDELAVRRERRQCLKCCEELSFWDKLFDREKCRRHRN